jgi:hypothetical protein
VTHIESAALEHLLEREYGDGNFRELTEVVHVALARAVARHSALLQLDDLGGHDGNSRFRSDRESAVIKVRSVPAPADVVEVKRARDLRVVAQREARVVLIDEDGVHWVLGAAVTYRWSRDDVQT